MASTSYTSCFGFAALSSSSSSLLLLFSSASLRLPSRVHSTLPWGHFSMAGGLAAGNWIATCKTQLTSWIWLGEIWTLHKAPDLKFLNPNFSHSQMQFHYVPLILVEIRLYLQLTLCGFNRFNNRKKRNAYPTGKATTVEGLVTVGAQSHHLIELFHLKYARVYWPS